MTVMKPRPRDIHLERKQNKTIPRMTSGLHNEPG